jgi:hypothetical protein
MDFVPVTPSFHQPAFAALARRKLVGIRFLAKRETVLRCGGADPGVFIQDVSLPLAVASRSNALAIFATPVVEVRDVSHSVSASPRQELHDFVLSISRLLESGNVPRAEAAILMRRAWQRLMKASLPLGLRAFCADRFARIALGGLSEDGAEALAAACRALAASGSVRLAGPPPFYGAPNR